MKCIVCNQDLRTSDREGIEILYCVQCGGVWLERGRLEQIISRVTESRSGDRDNDRVHDDDEHRGRDHDDDDGYDDDRNAGRRSGHDDRYDRERGRQRRRGGVTGFLSDLLNLD
jgi:uncharacterized protein